MVKNTDQQQPQSPLNKGLMAIWVRLEDFFQFLSDRRDDHTFSTKHLLVSRLWWLDDLDGVESKRPEDGLDRLRRWTQRER